MHHNISIVMSTLVHAGGDPGGLSGHTQHEQCDRGASGVRMGAPVHVAREKVAQPSGTVSSMQRQWEGHQLPQCHSP